MTTTEQAEATRALEEAMSAAVKAYDLLDEQVMVDWLVVIEGGSFDDNNDEAKFAMLFRHGQARHTVALGLLEVGKGILMASADRVDDD